MLKLIVNADDFGLCKGVNTGILDAFQHGIVTSTSLMASGSAFDHALDILKVHTELDTGVHLTLNEEQPVSNPQEVRSLLDQQGKFVKHATHLVRQYFLKNLNFSEIEFEFEAQINKILNTGIAISHLDSHQHIHMLPNIFRITNRLAKKYGIPAVRIPNEWLRPFMFYQTTRLSRISGLIILKLFCHLANKGQVLYPGHFAGFFFGGRLNKDNLVTILSHLPSRGTAELMCHPGADEGCQSYRHWSYHWKKELSALKNEDVIKLIRKKQIQLISFKDL